MKKMLKESLLYEKLDNLAVLCGICQRRCRIEDGEWGFCKTRINRKGKLFTSIYGQVSFRCRAPIEIKPVYHYLPGSYAFSMGSLGCNFLCSGCQNWDISFARVEQLATPIATVYPENSVEMAKKNLCQGISWTYNEPTLWFEFTLDGARLAKEAGLYTNYVTNGFISSEALDMIGDYLDIFRVDIKAFSNKAYQEIANVTEWKGILNVAVRAKKRWGMHVEVVTNVIPGINDDLAQMVDLAQWIKTELGADTPWHVTRFFPQVRSGNRRSTPVKTLEEIREAALKEGLFYVYIGNVSGHSANHTYCHGCGKKVIERPDYEKIQSHLISGNCPHCKQSIPGVF